MFGKQSALMQLAFWLPEVGRHIKTKTARSRWGGGGGGTSATVVARQNKQYINTLPRLICFSKTSALTNSPS